MFLFILESIGTSELMLIGVVALMFLGPRRMPQMAKKLGKIMSEFRGTANEFKETWQREVDFEEEIKAFDIKDLDQEPVARVKSIEQPAVQNGQAAAAASPSIKPVDPARLAELKARASEQAATAPTDHPPAPAEPGPDDKQNWL